MCLLQHMMYSMNH